MKKIPLLILTVIASTCLQAAVYERDQIKQTLSDVQIQQDSRAFVETYLSSDRPSQFLEQHLQSITDPLIAEYHVYLLLNEVAPFPPQPAHRQLIDDLKTFTPQATRMHDEGPLQIPVFNISSRAHGIENAWRMSESERLHTELLANSVPEALSSVRTVLKTGTEPDWLGIKNALTRLPDQSLKPIVAHVLAHPDQMQDLDRFVTQLALSSQSETLTELAISTLDTRHAETLLRHMPDHFPARFVSEQLIRAVRAETHTAFAMSLMRPLVDSESEVRSLLLEKLKDRQHAQSAAFSLAGIQQESNLQLLEQHYQNSTSSVERNHIILSLKMNPHPSAHQVLNRVKQTSLPDSEARNWLKSFEGESK